MARRLAVFERLPAQSQCKVVQSAPSGIFILSQGRDRIVELSAKLDQGKLWSFARVQLDTDMTLDGERREQQQEARHGLPTLRGSRDGPNAGTRQRRLNSGAVEPRFSLEHQSESASDLSLSSLSLNIFKIKFR